VSKLGEVWVIIGGGLLLAGLLLAWVGVLEIIWHRSNPKKAHKPRYRRKGASNVK
jgi:hypothetical protein